ncbi:ThiF family adenylyltransferase [Paenibacillus sp. FSL L8-0709]|uniref:ThiF family adenylyltransferase n=1 Tax=Paenibacillus sp. FSL L8-0709 TaxID=2975312 RepID=UPI0030FAA027
MGTTVEFLKLKNTPDVWIAKKYLMKSNDYYQPKWGKTISELEEQASIGIWIKLTGVPVLEPWHVPRTWEELQNIVLIQGINLMNIIQDNAKYLRDGKQHFITLGFPIPEFFGESSWVMNWQVIRLPILSYGNSFAKGFRKGELGYWQRDKTQIFRKRDKVNWISTENWNRNEILNRGRLDSAISQSSFLQIGAGSLGSMIAEQLVRADLQKLHIIDEDILQVGNLLRHTLDMNSLGENKAQALSRKLNNTVPHSNVKGINASFPSDQLDYTKYRVILDCTGEDDVIYKFQTLPLSSSKIFISVSLGYAAKRLFLYTHKTMDFSPEIFFSMLEPWFEKEKSSYPDKDFPREGIGCWHPVFPARIDDVWLMSAVAVKAIEKFLFNPATLPTLLIFEQKWDEGLFSGIELVHKEEWNE